MGAIGISTVHGQVIRLSTQAVVVRGQDVRLGNIATITGTDPRTAAALADTVVLPAVNGNKTIRAESVLMAVIAQWGAQSTATQLQLSGAEVCEITLSDLTAKPSVPVIAAAAPAVAPLVASPAAAVAPAAPVVVMASASNNTPPAESPSDDAPVAQTLSQLITTRIAHELGVGPSDFQVVWETLNPFKDSVAPDGGQWEFRPLTRTFVGTVMWDVEAVKGSRVTQRMTIETKVLRREMVLTATADISRGDPVLKGSYTVEEAWLDRDSPTLFNNEKDALGLAAQRNIVAGEHLDKRDFKPLLLAQRGDTITVVFVSGSLKVNMRAQAIQEGRLHDFINVQNDTTHEKYQVMLIGKKLAAVGPLTDAQEKELREAL